MPNDSKGRAIKPYDLVTLEGKYSVAAVHESGQYDVDLIPVDPHPSNDMPPIPIRVNGSMVTLESEPAEEKAETEAAPATSPGPAPATKPASESSPGATTPTTTAKTTTTNPIA